jgi:hypothetical protein
MQLGKISSEDLVVLLGYVPLLFSDEAEARGLLVGDSDRVLSPDSLNPSWCHLYELPAKEHFGRCMVAFGAVDMLKELAQAPNQLQVMAQLVEEVRASDDEEPDEEDDLSDEERENLRKSLGLVFGLGKSIMNSLQSLLIFGHYINDLVAIARAGGVDADRALLSAVKIDPTVLGCPTAVARLSRAVMLDDKQFLAKVRLAIGGALTKREQKGYQQMRLVLQVLHESKAPKLGSADLYKLFHDELNLVRREDGVGDVKGALRQFAYQFMEGKAVSE